MPGIEFLPERDDADDRPPGAARVTDGRFVGRIVAAVAALALIVVAAVVVGTGGGGSARHPAAAQSTVSPSPSISSSISPSKPATLSLPESVAFGPEAVDVLADGNRVFALTPGLVGVAERDSGAVTVRPTPIGLNQVGNGKLVPDMVHRIIWVVAIGGTAIGAYDTDHLDTLADAVAPYPINGAVAMDEQLYFTTDHGLYAVGAGPGQPKQVPGPAIRLSAVTADLANHQILAADTHSPNRLHVLTSYGTVTSLYLPFPRIDSISATTGKVWATGELQGAAAIFQLDPDTLESKGPGSVSPELGSRDDIVGTYGNRLLVRATPDRTSLLCMDGTTGAFKQKWTVPAHGAVSLNQRGLLVTTSSGIAQLNARDCLAGS
jgi:hypothetical protein